MPIVVVPERITVKRIVLLVGAAIATVFGSLALWAGVASAWQPVIGQTTGCVNEGGWTVHWTVGNSETAAGHIMTFDSATVNGVSISLTPSSVAPGASATGISTHSSATDSVTLVVHARWANTTPNETASAHTTVVKPDCVETTTTSTVAPTSTTTTVAPTTTTVPQVTTTVPNVEDTAVVRESVVPEVTTQAGPQVEAAQVSAAADTNALPATGTISAPLVMAGASLLLIGAALLVAARRHGATV